MEYKTQVGIFETGEKDSQGGAYKDNRFLALRKRELNEYEVKEGVAIIGDRAFYDAKLRTVTLPNSLRAIGQSAFAGCKNLTDVALPEGLEVIKDAAFRDCESLAELTLPSTLLEVGARAFGPGLKRLVILSENVTFSPDAFKQAKSLEEIHVPEAACAKYTVWFVALGLTAKITEIKEKNEIEESNTGNNANDIDNIDKWEETIDEEQESGRTIRVDLTRSGIKRITMLPLDNEGVEIMKEHGNDAEGAYSDIYDKVWSQDSGQLMDFVCEHTYREYELCVVDAETEEVIYEDDSFVPDTCYGLMSYSEAEANYSVDDDEDGFSSHMQYLRSECQTNELYLSQGFAKAWNELSEPTTESAATFIPNFMRYALSAADAKNALLMGIEESDPVTVSFYINLPEGEDFDPDKLDFFNIDEDYDAYSKVLQKLLARDIILLNAIIYDGKIYFAGHDDIDIFEDSDENPIFDYVDENIAHMALPSSRKNETLMKNELYIEKLGDWFREFCIVETEDDVYYDAYSATEEERELFVNNIKANYCDEEAKHIENLSFATADDFVKFLNDDEEDLSLADTMVCAAFCAKQGIAIDDDTRICEDVQLYYFNDCREFHYEYETDIDLG